MGNEDKKKIVIDADDPRWTAYALGELEGAERAEFDAAVEASDECAMRVAEIREMGALLEREFTGTGSAQLTDSQRSVILDHAGQVDGAGAPARALPMFWKFSAAAAAIAVIGVSIAWQRGVFDNFAVTRTPIANSELAKDSDSMTPRDDRLGRDDEAVVRDVTVDSLEVMHERIASSARLEGAPPATKLDRSTPGVEGKALYDYSQVGTNPIADPAAKPNLGVFAAGPQTAGANRGPGAPSAAGPSSPVGGGVPGPSAGRGGNRSSLQFDEVRPPVTRNPSVTGSVDTGDVAGALVTESEVDIRARAESLFSRVPQGEQKEATGADEFFMGIGGGGGKLGAEATKRTREILRVQQQLKSVDHAFELTLEEKDELVDRARVTRVPHDQTAVATDESYAPIHENSFLTVKDAPLSTFSIDVDTASYANVRRMLRAGQLPPPDAVRIEEMLNYFAYDDAEPTGEHPFSIGVELATCPWQPNHRIARVALRGKSIEDLGKKRRNLVFLIDVSGSMDSTVKLPLLKKAMRVLVDNLREDDRVAIVTYAGASGCALEPTPCNEKAKILAAIDSMSPGGSTNGAAGIELAYDLALRSFDKDGINRVLLATDGDFNVGVSADGPLTRLIEEKAKTGVFLSVLGFGTGNLKDSKMEALADHGNGNYAYIDSLREARKVLVDQLGGTLQTIAKDVKIQIEFNPAKVGAYRLIGYENRVLQAQDFNDDRKDAGEIGAGHRVTALYQIVPVGGTFDGASVDPLRYQTTEAERRSPATAAANLIPELMNVKVRYKQPDGQRSTKIEHPVLDSEKSIGDATTNLRFAAAVAQFGMLLRHSRYAGSATLESVRNLANSAKGTDAYGYRAEFIELVERAAPLFDR